MTTDRLYEILLKYAESQGIQLNMDKEYVIEILEGLLKNESRYGYRSCPCRLAAGVKEKDKDIICPCVYRDPDIKEYGSCYCRLYVSKEWNEEKIKHVKVPERRPTDKQGG
ncbi:MAG: ferredoxin:thioredoxin reductase [Thermodesulfovibrio sp. RBG_19FT_COMBO_42_12]|nr:MAG: ferredoxin:thioredoxin reductase [Thermodesulfovibrio sp. RBG_19FT_COMBO_42_12]